MPEEISIIDTRRVPSATPERIGRMDVFITYQTADMRTYMIMVPGEEFTEEKVRELIRKDLEERAQWTGKKISI